MLSLISGLLLSLCSFSLFSAPVAAKSSANVTWPPESWVVGASVKTTSGTFVGHPSALRPNVSEYLGIPFAQPPLGDLRFAAPQPYKRSGVFNASTYVRLTPEQVAALIGSLNLPVAINLLEAYGQAGNTHSEDCLTLNVWTKPQVGETKKAVMVWIYGGGFESGATHNPFYDGSSFADDQDVVLVSINYRTNVFGFPGLPSSTTSKNAGLMDQRMAIEWVRDNIDSFGGDKERITLFGQSAGGASVDIYSYAYRDDPIVHAFIAQSGTATAFFDPAPKNNTKAWFNASASLGCGNESVGVEASLACVRKVPFEKLLNATVTTDPLMSILGSFGPTVDGKIVFDNYAERSAHGDFVQKPLLIGNNDYEAGLFRLLTYAAASSYPDIAWCLFNTDIFTCPVSKAAQARVRNGVPVWRYRYFGNFYNLRLTNNPDSGTWHGSEIPIVFKTAEKSSGVASTPAEMQYQNYLQGAWAAFAKDPEGAFSGDDDSGYDFKPYDPHGPSLIEFAKTNTTFSPASYTIPSTYDSLCTVLDIVDASIPGGLIGAFTGGSLNSTDLGRLLGPLLGGGNNSTLDLPAKPGFRCPF